MVRLALTEKGLSVLHYERPTATVVAAPPQIYIQFDGLWYQVLESLPPTLEYEQVGTDWAWYSQSVVIQNCASVSPLGDSRLFFIYSLSAPAMPITYDATYRTLSNAYGFIAVLTMHSIPGNVTCQGAVPVPPQYDVIFQDGMEASTP